MKLKYKDKHDLRRQARYLERLDVSVYKPLHDGLMIMNVK